MGVIYINTKVDKPSNVISDIGEKIGIGAASGLVLKWFGEYNEFVYDTNIGDIVLFKKATSGFWEVKQEHIVKWK